MKSVLSKLLVSQSGEQDRRTPKDVFEVLNKEFKFQLDPCTSSSKENNLGLKHYFTKEKDGLKQNWSDYDSIFINPPFKDMRIWVDKILFELEKSENMVIVLLAPSKTETKWWHKLISSKFLEELRFENRRLTFEGHKNSFIIGISYFVLKSEDKQ